MTEADWLACKSTKDLLYYATYGHDPPSRAGPLRLNLDLGCPAGHVAPTPRQLALAVVGWVELAGGTACDEATARAIRMLTAGADGMAGPETVSEFRTRQPDGVSPGYDIWAWSQFILWGTEADPLPVEAAEGIADVLSPLISPADQCEVLRDVLGNPFRPISINPTWLSWHAGLLVAMARRMYDSRDFSDMPVLADALEEADCTNPEILGHCRSGGEHVRGCWLVDALLGRS